MRALAILLLVALGLAGIVCFVFMASETSPLVRAADGACLLVVIAAATGVSFLVWPRGAK